MDTTLTQEQSQERMVYLFVETDPYNWRKTHCLEAFEQCKSVITDPFGRATTPKHAYEQFGIRPNIVFVRKDGWTVGAPHIYERTLFGQHATHMHAVIVKVGATYLAMPYMTYAAHRMSL